jgi:hypothetical protein
LELKVKINIQLDTFVPASSESVQKFEERLVNVHEPNVLLKLILQMAEKDDESFHKIKAIVQKVKNKKQNEPQEVPKEKEVNTTIRFLTSDDVEVPKDLKDMANKLQYNNSPPKSSLKEVPNLKETQKPPKSKDANSLKNSAKEDSKEDSKEISQENSKEIPVEIPKDHKTISNQNEKSNIGIQEIALDNATTKVLLVILLL